MEVDDPIQQLLKNTGWSCDDLLEKLQKYKSQTVPNEEKSNNSIEAAEKKKRDGVSETTNPPNGQIANLPVEKTDKPLTEVTHNLSNNSNAEDFSDTDEEEVEVNVTNTNIINEIIEDIYTENIEESIDDTNRGCSSQVSKEEETTEVTEVRVIEVNTDEEDDKEENIIEGKKAHNVSNSEETHNTVNIEYLETYPRRSESISTDVSQTGDTEDHQTNSDFKENPLVLQKSSITSTPQTKIVNDTASENPVYEDNILLCKSNSPLDKIKQTETEDVVVVVETENPKFANPKFDNDRIKVNLTNTRLRSPVINDLYKYPNEDTVPINLEDIRNNLKLQLSCLRTRKKGHFFKEMRSNIVDEVKNTNKISTENLNNNNTISKAPCIHKNQDLESKSLEINSTNDPFVNNDNDELYTQTNEFGLVILNVQGGIDIDEEGNDEINQRNISADTFNDSSSNTNHSLLENNSVGCNDSSLLPGDNVENDGEKDGDHEVFDEIRKIIRKPRCSYSKNKEIGIENNQLSEKRKSVNNYRFLSKSSEFQIDEEANQDNMDTDCASAENSSTTQGNTQILAKNSPFISNTLDEFLGNATLNISYNVPKCDAEEGLKVTYRDESPLVLKKIVKVGHEETPKPRNMLQTIKAKTVAQKRKILEKQRKMEMKKLRLKCEQTVSRIKPEISLADILIRNSYVMVNEQKIWVYSTTPDTCIARIKLPNEKLSKETVAKIDQKQRKPSLLTDLEKRYKEEVVYRPGPMSKKPGLQVSGQADWQTKTKILPKLFVEVVPGVGTPISSNILCRLPQHDGKLTNSQIEFALSVLKTKNCQIVKPKAFRFPLRYHNSQEKVMVRKQKIFGTECISEERDKPIGDDKIISEVINGLIKYVEVKEIAPTLIMEDENVEAVNDDDKFARMPTISDNVSNIIKKPHKRKSKVEMELSRLSCKVVNVEIEEKVETECHKPYCLLGCVCKSLKCERRLNYHCQKVECMLECTCPKEKSVIHDKLTLPAGTDILSTDAVNRIEDEAKKDLAKVEREFTQTVIHTSDKTIVVGIGGRNKARRITKAPKKYSDYVDSFEEVKEEVTVKIDKMADFFRKSVVNLEKLDLSRIVPFCLIHNLNECHCQGYTRPVVDDAVITPGVSRSASINIKKVVEEIAEKPVIQKRAYVSKKVRKFTIPQVTLVTEPEEPPVIRSNDSTHSDNVSDTEKLVSKRPIRNTKKTKLKMDFSYSDEVSFYSSQCARVCGISRTHIHNSKRYTVKQKNHLTKNDFENNITDVDFLKSKICSSSGNTQMLEVDLFRNYLISEAKRKKQAMSLLVESTYSEKGKRKRKQTLETRQDQSSNLKFSLNQDMAMQRRKSQLLRKKNSSIEHVFEGEIIIDKRNMELLQKMGPRTVSDGYARLLPWNALIESFKKGTINIWSMVDQPSRLLINKSDKLPPKNYVNITDSTAKAGDVTLWILYNKLPNNYQEDNVSFILKQTKDNYEICGLCTKNLTEENASSESENSVECPNPKVTLFKHKDLNGISQFLFLTKKKYKLQELVEENMAGIGETSIEKSKLYMWAALPDIHQVCKWRMIFLNSDFTYLYFTNLKYSIKYTDLLTAANMAKTECNTVMLRNKLMENANNHKYFGLYFDPYYIDRLFIGPYFKQHNEGDVETLRYINKSLVCTESFSKMQGKTNYKCGHWLIERPYWGTRKRPAVEQTIDLTNDDCLASPTNKRRHSFDSTEASKRPRVQPASQQTGESGQIIIHESKQIRVIDGEPRKPEDFNRYIITNIPHFGYLGAYQHESKQEIDVSWPFENKLLRFPNVTTAVSFLQERFSSLMQPIPESFKINVIVLTQIDLNNSHPINASILSGHYICGNFGCYNVKTIENDFCHDKLGISREAVLRIFARRAQAFVRKKVEDLANILNIHNEIGRYDIINILDTAHTEINSQIRTEKECLAQKNQLLLHKRELALKVFCLISTLPEREKQSENSTFKRIITNSTKSITTNADPIEIPDSDEEDFISDSKNEPFPKNDGAVDDAGKSSDTTVKLSDSAKSITETSVFLPVLPSIKLKSLLKSNVANSLAPRLDPSMPGKSMALLKSATGSKPKKTAPNQAQYLTGVKIVKTQSGKLLLVSDKGDSNKLIKARPTSGTAVVIKNNQVLSVKPIEGAYKESVSTSDKPTNNQDSASEGDSECVSQCSISENGVNNSNKEYINSKNDTELNVDVTAPLADDKNCESSSESVVIDAHTETGL